MRKVYLIIGTHNGGNYHTWVVGVFSSYKKALKALKILSIDKTEYVYDIQTEVII